MARSSQQKRDPSPVTVVVHSTGGFTNNALFFRVLDQNLAVWNIVKVIAEDGSAVADWAQHWCEAQGNRVKFVRILVDLAVPQAQDRKDRYARIIDHNPDTAFFFNHAPHWVELATALHKNQIPVQLVRPNGFIPEYITWDPGMMRVPPTLDDKEVARQIRKARPKRVMTPEEKAAHVKAEQKKRDERKTIKKQISRPLVVAAKNRGYSTRRSRRG